MTKTSLATPPPVALTEPWSWKRLLTAPVFGPCVALVLATVFFATQSATFLTGPSLSLILQQVMVVGTLAIGQTLIILVAGIDLSVGTIMAFGSIVMAKLAVDSGLPWPVAVGAGIATCTVFGLVNGLLVTRIKLPPFIVTLGMLNIAYALTHMYSAEETVTNLPAGMTALGETFAIGDTRVTYGSVLMLVLFGVVAYILGGTAWGQRLYAVGSNAEGTRLTGIPVDRVRLAAFTAAGAIYGIAALLLIARTGVGDPKVGLTENLESITAVVLGGTSLFGGRGAVLGTLVGVLIVGVFRSGLQQMGVGATPQILVTGILVILAVTVDQLARRRNR
ncbi:ABC transporter permease [Stackebrandtia nassauensis]|uniref:Inner-membrane translocator n=1 Tax=Stackebrandtia nassauensis (strain DSM 44728 / CIP 108903 / NRRL B-16338 / NBRC 102104 / LLR-40K-21) TaxID=446470 RepID=D3PWR0_STANL|nr:ABC transporter permease [Stackebrandtia nassauensis]ADD43282.1 inner-membrane translocator [Stackebrandtia nassauensis DSM 44728]